MRGIRSGQKVIPLSANWSIKTWVLTSQIQQSKTLEMVLNLIIIIIIMSLDKWHKLYVLFTDVHPWCSEGMGHILEPP